MAFAGAQAIVYFHGAAQTLRLHVDRGMAAHLWVWLSAVVETLRSKGDAERPAADDD
jgi:hypothetical protein